MTSLTGKQRRHLRGLGHALKPLVQVGQDDLTDGVISACDQALTDHELIKVKVGEGASTARHEAGEQLAQRTKSELVQVLGRTLLLYRRHPEKPKISLGGGPKVAGAVSGEE
jgi:RNA-binding protein